LLPDTDPSLDLSNKVRTGQISTFFITNKFKKKEKMTRKIKSIDKTHIFINNNWWVVLPLNDFRNRPSEGKRQNAKIELEYYSGSCD